MSNLSDVMSQRVNIPEHIPSDWSWLGLTEVTKPKQWKTISSSDMTESGYPVFGANGFVGYYPEYNHELETVTITCRGNTCGTINRVPQKTYITGNSMALDAPDTNRIDQNYLYYSLSFRTVSDTISGSAQPQITRSGLEPVQLPAPPLPEQQKIATILTSVDNVIESTQAQINKLEDLKTGMMQELLTQGIGHSEFKDSPVGRIPVGWEVKPLSELVKPTRAITYGIVQTGSAVSKGIPCVRVVDLVKEQLSTDIMITTSSEISRQYQRTVLEEGDLMFALRGVIGHVRKVERSLVGANLTRGVALISPGEMVSSGYLMWAIRSQEVRRKILDGVNGSALQEIPLGNLRGVEIPVPSKSEQIKIDTSLSSVERNISDRQRKLRCYVDMKKALMQDLLTGKVRVKTD